MAQTDELIKHAAKIVTEYQSGSASLLQRRLQIGYNRSIQIIDQLEAAEIIGPFRGSRPREVHCKTFEEAQKKLNEKYSI